MKKLLLIILLLFLVWMMHGKKLCVLDEILKPSGIEIFDNHLYVIQDSTFFVYDLQKLKFINTFGKRGQGPGELSDAISVPVSIRAYDNFVVAEGMNKLIFFSKDFKAQKEVKKKGVLVYKATPIGKNFVAIQMKAEKNKIILVLSLYDSKMNPIKELYRQESFDRQKELVMLRDTIHFDVYKDQLYIEKSENEFFIEVYNSQGKNLYEIKKDIGTLKVTENDRKVLFNILKQDRIFYPIAQQNGGWDKFEKTGNFRYSEKFPYIKNIIVRDDKIFASTYLRKNNKEKFIIMDLKGNIINTVYLPIPTERISFFTLTLGKENRFYGFNHNKYYYLLENEDEETWELHSVELN